MRGAKKPGLVAVAVAAALAMGAGQARAKGDPLIGAKLVETVKPIRGFVDDPFEFDAAGGRLVYVATDAAKLSELRVIDLTQNAAQLAAIDISKFSTTPTGVHFVLDGDHYLVVSRPTNKSQATAALFKRSGKLVRKFGPADDIRLLSQDGKAAVVLYSAVQKKPKKGDLQVHHSVEIRSLKSGRRIGKKRTLVADGMGKIGKLDFRISYWTNDYTQIVGIRGGTWDRKEDQRSPDHEAWYDITTATFSKTIQIKNVVDHARRMKVLSQHGNEPVFARVASDLSGIIAYDTHGSRNVELTETFFHYDHNTLTTQVTDDGTIFFTMKIDPVHPDAAARRRAVPEYLDLYQLVPGATKAVRKARMLSQKRRKYHWRATDEYWVLQPRHIGFDRGGKELQIYKLH